MSTRPNAEAEWEARIARIEAAQAAPESWAGGPWRIGRHYGIHVYEGNRPVATFHRAEDAARCVKAVDGVPSDAMIRQAQAEALEEAALEIEGEVPRWLPGWLCNRAAALRVTTDKPDVTETEKRNP